MGKKDESLKEKIGKIEINKNNMEVLLQVVLSIMTPEQLDRISEILENVEVMQKNSGVNIHQDISLKELEEAKEFNETNKSSQYIGYSLLA